MKIVIASKNEDKIYEIINILNLDSRVSPVCRQARGQEGLEFLTFKDFEDWWDVEETGSSFEENAILKAKELAEKFNLSALADDSGLEVDILNGKPGIYSSRYAGESATDEENIVKLLDNLKECSLDKRTAQFKCCAVFFIPPDKIFKTEGVCKGQIIFEPRGSKGFGYDPIFVPDGFNETMAELPIEIKNKISHRGQAFRKMRDILNELKI
ncbi:MAG TPA: RdgB/HAM1 family non-canonical purine NTP pyrophosphatase [Actinobacteria bacterium]|nr:RdgB/HAM1 family non-canonical purine NTP pyrophosphatase [Actinomycetota bacterium]